MERLEQWFSLATLQRPYQYLIGSFLVIGLCIAGLQHIGFDADPSVYFSEDHEHYQAYKELEDTYGRADSAVIVVKAKQGSLYTQKNLAIVEALTEKAWGIPYAGRVDSLANYNYSYSIDDELFVEPLIENALSLSDEQIANIETIAKNDPDVKDRLASSRTEMIMIRITAVLPMKNRQIEEYTMADATEAITQEYAVNNPDIEFLFSGNVFSNAEVTKVAQNDVMQVVPMMYAAIFIMLGVLLRSAVAVVSIFIITILSSLAALGLASWAGLVINMMSITSVNIIITVAIAHCVHILVYYLQQYHGGEDKFKAISESLRINFVPITLTSLTTALGFLSMNLSKMPPAHDLGNITATGVVIAFLLSLFLLPPLLLLLPIKRRQQNKGSKLDKMMNYLGAAVVNRYKPLLLISIIFSASMLVLVPQNVMNDKFTESIKMPNEFQIHNQQIDKYFGGLYTIEYNLKAKGNSEGGIAEPEYLAATDKLATWLRQQPEVRSVQSYTDLVKRLNQNMHNDDKDYYKLPDTRDEAAQYQLLYEMSQPFGSDMTNTIRQDKSATRLIAFLPSTDTTVLIDLQQRAQAYVREELPGYMFHTGEGLAVMWAYLGQEAIVDALKGAILALFLISIILMLVFRSFKYGLISLIPNLLPAGVGYGVWAIINGELSMGQMMVLSITIGIVVDDTVHFLTKYLRARRELNNDAQAAVRYAFRQVGPALWITTAVLIIGFGMLLQSGFMPNSDLGLLTAIILVSAISLDFFLLPPLLILLDKNNQR